MTDAIEEKIEHDAEVFAEAMKVASGPRYSDVFMQMQSLNLDEAFIEFGITLYGIGRKAPLEKFTGAEFLTK